MTNAPHLLLGCLAILTFVGCGGGTGSSGDISSNVSQGSRMRALKPGDTWTYTLTGSARGGSGAEVPASGTLTVSVSTATLASTSVLTETWARSVISSDAAVVKPWVYFVQQDAVTRAIYELADQPSTEGSPRLLTKPALFVPGSWSAGLRLSTPLDFGLDGGGVRSFSTAEQVAARIAAGTFTTWRTTTTDTYPDGTRFQTTMLYAPALGAPVKLTLVQADWQGIVLNVSGELTATTVR